VTAHYSFGTANIGSHLFDALRFLLGDIAWVTATGTTPNDPDPTLSGLYVFRMGQRDTSLDVAAMYWIFEIDIVGNKGRV